jgi:hypothetical protein
MVMATQGLLDLLQSFGAFRARLPFPEKNEALSADATLDFAIPVRAPAKHPHLRASCVPDCSGYRVEVSLDWRIREFPVPASATLFGGFVHPLFVSLVVVTEDFQGVPKIWPFVCNDLGVCLRGRRGQGERAFRGPGARPAG